MERKNLLSSAAVVLLLVALATQVAGEAGECNPSTCSDSTCRCSSTAAPGGLQPAEVPQFVVLTFDDSVTPTNFPFYQELTGFRNPNWCPISITFFVTHVNTDYTLVNKLHRMGHEISTHSVSHVADVENYWRKMNRTMWTNEIVDMKTMLQLYGNIQYKDIKGFRVPFLEVGGNLMYDVLAENNFMYDCSWPTLQYTPWFISPGEAEPKGALWPYTLDYMSVQEETLGTKPTDSFPGLWLNPMTDMQDNRGEACVMLDACQSAEDELETSADAVANMLKRNFKWHHYKDRTPFGLYVHASWFWNSTVRHDGFRMFLEYLTTLPDVYVVSVDQLIQWTQNPVALDDIDDFEPLTCDQKLPPDTCPEQDHTNCYYNGALPINEETAYMKICQGPCPRNYPWVGNPYGE